MRKVFLLLLMSLIVVFCLLTTSLVSIANERIVAWEPGVGTGAPFYARIERGWTLHTDEWAAILFYREPYCVRKDFNLLDFFDFPAAFGCETFVKGFEVRKDGMMPPIQGSLKDAGPMHVYFFPWSAMQVALADDMLTMPELEGLDGLGSVLRKGITTSFTETIHPTGNAQQSMEEIVAKGYMEEKGSVRFELKSTWVHDDLPGHSGLGHAKIEFKTAKSAPSLRPQSNIATTWGGMKGKY